MNRLIEPRVMVMGADAATELDIRVDRLEALFQETSFVPTRPHLDPGPAFDHLVRRVNLRKCAPGTRVRVHLASEPMTPMLQSTAATAVKMFSERRAQELRATVRAMRHAGRRALFLSLCLLVTAVAFSLTLTHFKPLPAPYNDLFGEALVVAGWVLLWRPMELLFYEWIEPWRDARNYERLAELPLELLADDMSLAPRTTRAV